MNKWMMLLCCVSLLCSCDSLFSDGSESSDTGTGGSMARFTVNGNYLYVVDQDHLMTFDISDSSKIALKSKTEAGWQIETIFPTDSLLFLGSTSGMIIFSLRQPDRPTYLSTYTHITSCDPVVVKGRYAYVTLRSDNVWSCWNSVNELQVIDISNIKKPIQIKSYEMTSPKGLAITDSLLFVCDGLDLVVMSAANPLDMKVEKRVNMDGTPFDVIARDGVLTVSYSQGLSQYSYDGDTIQWISTVY